MNQSNVNNSSSLKKKLIFLKSIDQKLEGLRRENERLLRLASNPRVAFSRSSLASLFRIINSLISAGPMYGFTEIERWAETWRERLISLGKQGTGPTPDELENLLLAIGELGRMRDEAIAAVEKSMKAAGKTDGASDELIPVEEIETDEEVPPSDRASLEPIEIEPDFKIETDSPESPWSSVNDKQGSKEKSPKEEVEFPFFDEPKSKSLAETTFAPKVGAEKVKKAPELKSPLKNGRRLREESNTIPIALDEISMIGTISKIPPGAPAPKGKRELFWKVFALLSFAGFVVMTALYLREMSRETSEPATSAKAAKNTSSLKEPPISPADSKQASNDAKPPVAQLEQKSTGEETTIAPSALVQENEKGKSDGKTAVDKKADKHENKDKGKEKSVSKDSKSGKASSSTSSSSSKSASSSPSGSSGSKQTSANKETGTLSVLAPGDGSEVFVLVDGISKGKAPIKTNLSAGLHEVVFTAGGKRAMRMVPIKTDQTKTVTAVKPE